MGKCENTFEWRKEIKGWVFNPESLPSAKCSLMEYNVVRENGFTIRMVK